MKAGHPLKERKLPERELPRPTDRRRHRKAGGYSKPRTGRTANRVTAVLEPHVRYLIWQYAERRGVTMGTEASILVLEGLKARGHNMSEIMAEWLKYVADCQDTGEENLFPGKDLGDGLG